MIEALSKIRNDAAQNALIGLLESKKFTNMYEHFIVVTCTTLQYQIENFSDFVGKRLGHEFIETVQNPLEKWIKFCHVSADHRVTVGEGNALYPKSAATSCKKIWLIGIELKESFVQVESEYVDEPERLEKL
uniref:S-adenosyl-L-methionine-dependent methyltransferase n=1 Tax=Globodera pallida TaxID=36090 RepID=A0A183CNC5_GLOPA